MAEQTQRHQVSLAVWDVPATVVAGERFAIRAGATSSAGCDLRGRRIEACDAATFPCAAQARRYPSAWNVGPG